VRTHLCTRIGDRFSGFDIDLDRRWLLRRTESLSETRTSP
jgi:hypothetical protein